MILVVTHKDIPLCVLIQLSWWADGDRPKQAIQFILSQHLCQENVPRCVVLLHPKLPLGLLTDVYSTFN